MRKRVLLDSQILSVSGYGVHSRTVLRALRSREDLFDIYVIPKPWGKTGWLHENNLEREYIDFLIQKTVEYQRHGGQFDIHLFVGIANELPEQPVAPRTILVTAGIETTKVSPQWVDSVNRKVERVITISEHSKKSFEDTVYQVLNEQTGQIVGELKCAKPVDVVHYPVRDVEPAELNLELEHDFNFLVVAQWSPRKNIDNTVRWFLEHFKNGEVGLVLKLNTARNNLLDADITKNRLVTILNEFPERQCSVTLLHGNMDESEMTALYRHPKIKAYVTLSHGEGFGLGGFEAAYNGLPVIAPDWSGHLDYLYKPVKKNGKEKLRAHFGRVSYTLQPIPSEIVWEGVLQEGSMWCYPEQGSFKQKLDEVLNDYSRFKSQATKLKKWLFEEFSEQKQYEKFVGIISPEEDDEEWLAQIEGILNEHD